MKQFSLSRAEMLKSKKTLERIFREGKNLTVPPIRVHYIVEKTPAPPGEKPVLMAVGAGKKFFKKAVDRNRIKRLMREAYRLQKHSMQQSIVEKQWQLSVFFQFTGRALPPYDEIVKSMATLLTKLQNRMNEQVA